jgi:phage/plasmid-associated DNA primase
LPKKNSEATEGFEDQIHTVWRKYALKEYEQTLRWDCNLECYMMYNISSGCFEAKKDKEINKLIVQFGEKIEAKINPSTISMCHNSLIGEILIHNNEWNAEDRYINCKNGVYDFETGEFMNHAPQFLFTQQFHANFIKDPKPTPYIDKIRTVYPIEFGNFERFVQAILHNDINNEQMVFLQGPTRSGKSTFLELLTLILGTMAVIAHLKDIESDFGLYLLLNARVLIDPDLRQHYLSSIDNLLKIIGKDTCQHVIINAKFLKQFNAKIKCFFIVATNQFPTLPTGTNREAFFRRVWIIQLLTQFKSDPIMKDEILKEVDDWFSSLLLKPYVPWAQFIEDKTWVEQQAAIWDYSAKPIKRYLNEMFIKTKTMDDSITQDDLLDWIRIRYTEDNYEVPKDQYLKELLTSEFASMKVRKRTTKGEAFFYPLAIREEWSEFCLQGISKAESKLLDELIDK